MSSDRHRRALELFREVADLGEAERTRVLEEMCGDDVGLRRALERLIKQQSDETVAPDGDPTLPPLGSDGAPVTETDRLKTGDLFSERYRVIDLLGRGGMGEVYRAQDTVLNVPVAVKLLVRSTPEAREQLLREVRLARDVTHPAVVRVFDVGEADGETFITMEYVDGEDLKSLLARIGQLAPDKVLEIAHQLCGGLAAAHAQGVLHRDLKPGNIMIDGQGKVRITDFGVALRMTGEVNRGLAGTPAYMAPEQLGQGGSVGPPSDIYAVGLILHEALTGQTAFEGKSLTQILKKKLTTLPDPPSSTLPGLHPKLDAAIMACLQRDPAKRPQSALELETMLPNADPLALAVEIGETPDPSMVADAGSTASFSRRWIAGWAVALVALLCGVMVLCDLELGRGEVAAYKAPLVLADRAAGLLEKLGEDTRNDTGAFGYLNPIEVASRDGSPLFWFRANRAAARADVFERVLMRPFGGGSRERIDAGRASEMDLVVLDQTGRLVYLEIDAVFSPLFATRRALTEGGDWEAVLEPAELTDAPIRRVDSSDLTVYADVVAAWEGRWSGGGEEIRVEAAALGDRPVYFAVRQQGAEAVSRLGEMLRRSILRRFVVIPITLIVLLTAIVLGVRNLVRGRSDLRVARTLLILVLTIETLAAVLLGGREGAVVGSADLALTLRVFFVIAAAGAVTICYLGLEPAIRRLWPQTLVGWVRLFRGRWTDPSVGVALLVGSAAGALWALLGPLDGLVVGRLIAGGGHSVLEASQLEALTGLGPLLATTLRQLFVAIIGGLLILFLIAIVNRVVTNGVAAFAVLIAVLAAIAGALGGSHVPWSLLFLGVPVALLAIVVLYRFGLLAFVVASLCHGLLASYPITLDPGVWFADGGLYAVVLVALIGGLGGAILWSAVSRTRTGQTNESR